MEIYDTMPSLDMYATPVSRIPASSRKKRCWKAIALAGGACAITVVVMLLAQSSMLSQGLTTRRATSSAASFTARKAPPSPRRTAVHAGCPEEMKSLPSVPRRGVSLSLGAMVLPVLASGNARAANSFRKKVEKDIGTVQQKVETDIETTKQAADTVGQLGKQAFEETKDQVQRDPSFLQPTAENTAPIVTGISKLAEIGSGNIDNAANLLSDAGRGQWVGPFLASINSLSDTPVKQTSASKVQEYLQTLGAAAKAKDDVEFGRALTGTFESLKKWVKDADVESFLS